MLVVVCLVNDYIKFILFVTCLVVLLHHHSWTLLSNVINDKKMDVEPYYTFDFLPLPFATPMSNASLLLCSKLFWKVLKFKTITTFQIIRNCSILGYINY